MEPLYVLFIMFSPLWWLLILGASVAIICSLEYETRHYETLDDNRCYGGGTWATITLVTTLLLLNFFSTTPLLTWISVYRYEFLAGVLGYFVGGAIWGVCKWYFFNKNRYEKYELEKRTWLHNKGYTGTEIPDNLKAAWTDYLKGSSTWSYSTDRYSSKDTRVVQIKLQSWQHKSRISMWMTYWVWSLAWSLLDDIVKNAFRKIQQHLTGLMESITNRVFKGVENDYIADKPDDKTKK